MDTILTDNLLDGKDMGFSLLELLMRFGINMLAVFILVRLIYYPRHKNKDFLFKPSQQNPLMYASC